VALPRAGALARLARLRSPAWAALLLGAILIGTFPPLWQPCTATGLVLAAAVVWPGTAAHLTISLVTALGTMSGRSRSTTPTWCSPACSAALPRVARCSALQR
jgi:hypothetical protein